MEGLVAGRADDGQDTTGAVLRELIQVQSPSPAAKSWPISWLVIVP